MLCQEAPGAVAADRAIWVDDLFVIVCSSDELKPVIYDAIASRAASLLGNLAAELGVLTESEGSPCTVELLSRWWWMGV